SDNIRPALYGSRYTVAQTGRQGAADHRPFRVVGRHCESGDVLGDYELPADLSPGALIAFASTGAYNYSMASNYNRVGRPAVVGVRDGASALWLRREDVADLDRLDVFQAPVPDAAAPAGVEIRPARAGDRRGFMQVLAEVAAERRYIRRAEVRPTR